MVVILNGIYENIISTP